MYREKSIQRRRYLRSGPRGAGSRAEPGPVHAQQMLSLALIPAVRCIALSHMPLRSDEGCRTHHTIWLRCASSARHARRGRRTLMHSCMPPPICRCRLSALLAQDSGASSSPAYLRDRATVSSCHTCGRLAGLLLLGVAAHQCSTPAAAARWLGCPDTPPPSKVYTWRWGRGTQGSHFGRAAGGHCGWRWRKDGDTRRPVGMANAVRQAAHLAWSKAPHCLRHVLRHHLGLPVLVHAVRQPRVVHKGNIPGIDLREPAAQAVASICCRRLRELGLSSSVCRIACNGHRQHACGTRERRLIKRAHPKHAAGLHQLL